MQAHSPVEARFSRFSSASMPSAGPDLDDATRFEHLFASYRDGLERFLYRSLGSQEDAEDAAALAFCKAWRARGTFRGGSSPKTWLYRIGARVALDMLRSRRTVTAEPLLSETARGAWESEDEPAALDPEEIVLHAEEAEVTRRALDEALEHMPEGHRRLFCLFYFEGHDYDAIGRQLGLTQGQVRSRLHRIRGWIRRDLSGQIAQSLS